MELRDYFSLIGRHLTVFVSIIVLCGLFAFFFTKFQPTSYTATATITVNKASSLKQSQASYYLYDNYYNVQSAGIFSATVTNWFSSPSLVKEIYQHANIEVPNVSENKLAKIFKAVREEPSTITVSLGGTDKAQLEKLINSAIVVLQTETNNLGKNNDSFYEIASFTPIVVENQPNLTLNTIIGLVSGVLLGIMVVLSIAYFKREEK